jgi:hypothetical protein
LAEELGVSSSVRNTSVRRDENSNSPSSTKKKGGFKLFARSSSTGEDAKGLDYQAVPADGSTAGLGLLNRPAVKPTTASVTGGWSQTMPDGMEPPLITITDKNDDITVRKEEPQMFDANGNRAPYREGPYDYHHDEDGRLIKKRWCK